MKAKRKNITWYPRNPRTAALFKGYALDNEMKDTELIGVAVREYFEKQNMNEARIEYLVQLGKNHLKG